MADSLNASIYKYTPEQVSSVTLESLKLRSRLARIVNVGLGKEFSGGIGQTVTIKAPTIVDPAKIYNADLRRSGQKIQYSNIFQPVKSIAITDMAYNAVPLTDEARTFYIQDLGREVIAPLAETVADEINARVIEAFRTVKPGLTKADTAGKGKLVDGDGKVYNSIDEVVDAGVRDVAAGADVKVKPAQLKANTHADVRKVIRYAGTALTQRGVPTTGRYLIVGSAWAQALEADSSLTKVNEAGTSDLLRNSTIANLSGFTIVEEPTLDPTEAYAYSADGIGLALVPPANALGAPFQARVSSDGFAFAYIHDYDTDYQQDRAVLKTFVGAEVLDPQRVLRLDAAEGIEEPAAPAPAAEAA